MYVDPLFMQFPDGIEKEDFIIATYYIQTNRDVESVKYAAAIAVEQTSGTWTPVPGETPELRQKHLGRVVGLYEIPAYIGALPDDVLERQYILRVAFPVVNVGTAFSMILTVLVGNISFMGKLKLMDVEFPESYLAQFQGPKFGTQGIREVLGVYDRPLINNMIKPCTGLNPKQTAELAYEVALGGVDIIKDDELTADQPYCPLEERVKEVMKALKAADEEKGEKTIFTFNITDRTEKLRDNALRAIEAGANGLMVNTWTIGLDAARMLAEDPEINVPILSHPDLQGALSVSDSSGISVLLANAKLPRLAGMDMAILLSPYGKFPFSMDAFLNTSYAMASPWKNIKPMMLMPGGGTTQGHIEELIHKFGKDVIIAAGGAVIGHPMGTVAGGKAFRQGIDAVMKGQSLREACQDPANKELKAAIDAWGIYGEKDIYDLKKN
ncbi:MAG TPA: RuBisCO large subunit C-terminal-like domain-containing protein [Peptococcaceae bacterium]|jgi:2,3-diketo-5-methylthiopentyl-1-phosphate enolase|nr:ribulose 1,5-bisphosphate carboxylase [Clostridia bacterium]HOB81393.1 RuBisCO large subunit C-terminal-like domain-containing protein [Peptococcaceae bacterium]HPZ71534.1 RuBisCO large subunit C-terminal-like domain-containing protein [Peptococcaceae bacterium]HQD53444.1 RuBisCO large subunit C-terminal-like domain-containing protein [Peptococcaceae bacterium]